MENNETSVYDINDLSPSEILNEGDDRNNTNMNNNGNKKNKKNTHHMVNNKDRTTTSNNTGHLTNSKVLNNNELSGTLLPRGHCHTYPPNGCLRLRHRWLPLHGN